MKCLIGILVLLTGSVLSQARNNTADTARGSRIADTLAEPELRTRLKARMDQHLRDYASKKLANIQEQRFNSLLQSSDDISSFLQREVDTASMKKKVDRLTDSFDRSMLKATRGKKFLFFRDIIMAGLLVRELDLQLDGEQKKISRVLAQLEGYQTLLDSLATDTSIYLLPDDRTQFLIHVSRLEQMRSALKPVFSKLQAVTQEVRQLDTQLNQLGNELELAAHRVETERSRVVSEIYLKDYSYLWQSSSSGDSGWHSILSSFSKSRQILTYFLANNTAILAFSFVLTALVYLMLRWAKFKVMKFGEGEVFRQNPVFKHPLSSSIFLTVSIVQFFFLSAPFIFQALLIGVLIVVAWMQPSPGVTDKRLLVVITALLPTVVISNLLLDPSGVERWILFTIAVAGAIAAPRVLVWLAQHHLRNLRDRLLRFLISVSVICLLMGALANVFGRFSLAKTVTIAAYLTLFSSVLLLAVQGVFEKVLDLVGNALRTFDNSEIREKFNRVAVRLVRWLRYALYAGLAVIFARNFYVLQVVLDGLAHVLYLEVGLGSVAFTIYDVCLFFGVIIGSVALSNLIAFFLDEDVALASASKTGGLRNWGLLLRLAVIVVGFVLAFLAANIPLDRIALVIGALGVGIGFGLQSITANLISGIVLAIERPVEIGDQVEIGPRFGRVQAIGIRSTRVRVMDGSEVIVPNSDLLSQPLINWTLSDRQRRVELMVGVSYGADLQKTRAIVEEVLRQNEQVDAYPTPLVLLHDFQASSIAFKVLFWADIGLWMQVKSDLLFEIERRFSQEGIKIPFPQLDVHLKNGAGGEAMLP